MFLVLRNLESKSSSPLQLLLSFIGLLNLLSVDVAVSFSVTTTETLSAAIRHRHNHNLRSTIPKEVPAVRKQQQLRKQTVAQSQKHRITSPAISIVSGSVSFSALLMTMVDQNGSSNQDNDKTEDDLNNTSRYGTISSNSIPKQQDNSISFSESDSLLGRSNTNNSNTVESEVTQSSVRCYNSDGESSSSVGKQILAMAVPAAGALLLDPFMSLIDTAFVGRFATTETTSSATNSAAEQLAGMGTAAATLTLSFYLCNFLCTVTAPLIAQQRASNNKQEAIKTSGNAITLAVVLGTLLCVLLWSLSQPILGVMGTSRTGVNAGMYATQFLTIRSLAAPAVLCLEACTGIFRGYLDTRTPIVILATANFINLALDVILVAGLRLGPLGAAIATTSAEWISASLFLLVLAGKLPAFGTKELGKQQPKPIDDTMESTIIVPNWSIPPWSDMQPLITASTSVLLRAIVLQLSVAGAAAMAARTTATSVSSTLIESGIVQNSDAVAASSAVAAHQIGIQLWLLCSFICDSLAAASQGLVADALGRGDEKAVKNISITVFQYSFVLGLFLAIVLQLGTSTGLILDVFTRRDGTGNVDEIMSATGVRTALLNILPLIIISQPVNALVFAADGVLQGASEFAYQAKAMAVSGLTAVLAFIYLEHTQFSLTFGGDDSTALLHVWMTLLILQLARGLTSLYKLAEADGPIRLFS